MTIFNVSQGKKRDFFQIKKKKGTSCMNQACTLDMLCVGTRIFRRKDMVYLEKQITAGRGGSCL